MFFDDFTLGQEFKFDSASICLRNMLAFAHEYDPMPVHTDKQWGEESRFGDIIAPGIMSFMAVWANFVRKNIISEQFIAGKSFRVNWFIPVYDEDVLTGKAIITRLVERNPYNGIVEIRIVIHNQKDELVMDTYTEAIIARHSAAERLAGSVN